MNKNKRLFILLVILLVILIIALGASYALFTFNVTKNSNFKVKIGTLELSILDTITEDKFIMENTIPTKDEVALTQNGYTFTLKNTGTIDSYYTIYLDDILLSEGLERLDSSYIKFSLTNQSNNKNITGKLSDYPDREFESAFLNVDESVTYNLKMWVDYEAGNGAQNKYYATQIRVTSIQRNAVTYTESLLNGADPVLSNNLVAVLLADDGTVTKADINNEWYNYGNKNWANAVVLKNQNISYSIGAVIPETNIESYFVWIPKYSYQLWDLGNYSSRTTLKDATQKINIKFGLTNTSNAVNGECTTPITSGDSGNCQIGDYMTHPAFLAFNTNGIWVGKFETGYDGANSTTSAQINISDSSKVIIKSNVYSWRGIQPANAFQTSYNYFREADSHMMKNTEWGAVAYLSHSIYGAQSSIRFNNNSNFITGYSSTEEPTLGYNAETSIDGNKTDKVVQGEDGTYTVNYFSDNQAVNVIASTTGNKTGIYDMSGGAWEFMMGIMADTNGNTYSGRNISYNSGFTGNLGCPTCDSNDGTTSIIGINFPDSRYYDLYVYGNSDKLFSNRILGDATGEAGPFQSTLDPDNLSRSKNSWYGDYAYFTYYGNPWFIRGGGWTLGSETGSFAFATSNGAKSNGHSFRIVLAP